MTNPQNILNELKWRDNLNLDDIKLYYIHRGAPDDTKVISGRDVLKIGRSFMQTNSAMIPYHRIFKIVYNQKVVFSRK